MLVPAQQARGGLTPGALEWERLLLNAAAPHATAEIERVLKDNELVIYEWAPVHLTALLRNWFWKADAVHAGALDVWQKTCCYLYMPRLKDEEVYRRALGAGALSADFFGLAYGQEGERWVGFTLGEATVPILDGSLVLIEPGAAAAYRAWLLSERPSAVPGGGGDAPPPEGGPAPSPGSAGSPAEAPQRSRKTQFFGTVELEPLTATRDFAEIVNEVILHFTTIAGARVRLKVDVEVVGKESFSDAVVRTVSENARVLRFHQGTGFEE